jgi:hypothetical protein
MVELKTRKKKETEEELPESWSDRAREAARKYDLPVPENTPDQEEIERRLRQFEQEDGE